MMQEVRQAIENAHRLLICGHVNPDSDCLGSQLTMLTALRSMGKDAQVLLPLESVNRKCQVMLELVPRELLTAQVKLDDIDLIVVVDAALPKRINKPKELELPNVPICNIDHHLGNERYGKFNWVDATAASCSQMVFTLLDAMNVKFTSDQATLLYAGLHGDTGGFSLANTNPRALEIAAAIAKREARIGWVCQKLHRGLPIGEFNLMQVVYANTKLSDCGRYAWSTVAQSDFAATGTKPDDIDEQVLVPRSIESVKIAILFSETKPGSVRLNLRSEDEINILPLAKSLGGGGHAQAAGATMHGPFNEVVERVKKIAIDFLDHPETLRSHEMEKINAK
jgi:phosphoesterase RecJ-like protein